MTGTIATPVGHMRTCGFFCATWEAQGGLGVCAQGHLSGHLCFLLLHCLFWLPCSHQATLQGDLPAHRAEKEISPCLWFNPSKYPTRPLQDLVSEVENQNIAPSFPHCPHTNMCIILLPYFSVTWTYVLTFHLYP